MTTVPLWDGPAPRSEGWDLEEVTGPDPGWVRNVTVPALTPHLPEGGSDRAVLVCPGGAFHFLSMQSEGRLVAEALAAHGVAAYVLKYRVVPTPPDEEGFGLAVMAAFSDGIEAVGADVIPLAVADAERAVELVRDQGHRHVTVLGFSAGARITAELTRRGIPDAAGAIYLPSVPPHEAAADAPPLFVLAAADDPLGIDGSLDLHRQWREGGAPVELHLFERGGHGFGMQAQGLPVDRWLDLFVEWHAALPD